jgi:hypothetical protein
MDDCLEMPPNRRSHQSTWGPMSPSRPQTCWARHPHSHPIPGGRLEICLRGQCSLDMDDASDSFHRSGLVCTRQLGALVGSRLLPWRGPFRQNRLVESARLALTDAPSARMLTITLGIRWVNKGF